MYTFDLTTIQGFLTSLWALLWGALSLDPDAYQSALDQKGGARLSLAVLFLAGLSITFGRSVILFANRVPRRRFFLSLVLSSLLLIAGVFFWAATVWLLATYLFGVKEPFRSVLIVVSLSYAPMIYGVFVLLPYLGTPVDIGLRIWILIGVVVAVYTLLPLALWQALLCCLLGWVALEWVVRLPLVTAVESGLWRLTTGVPEILSTEDMVESFIQEIRAYSRTTPLDGQEEQSQ
jgi:hypothetical protein